MPKRRLVLGVVALAGFCLQGPASPQQGAEASRQAREMSALDNFKSSYTEIEKKLADVLVYELRRRRDDPALRDLLEALPKLHLPSPKLEADGRIRVEIWAKEKAEDPVEATRDIVEALELLGGSVETIGNWVKPIVYAVVPLEAVEELAKREDVGSVGVPPAPMSRSTGNSASRGFPTSRSAGVVNRSEGDVAHQATVAREAGSDGTGITACVLSDGVDSLATVQGTGDLPAVTVLPGLEGTGDEGTAMLEVIHDLARGAELAFATAGSNPASAAASLDALGAHGCDVIATDVLFDPPAGSFFPSPYEIEIEDLGGQGVFVFASASNLGNFESDTAAVWEGDYVPRISPLGNFNDWGDDNIDNMVEVDAESYVLIWSDAVGNVVSDYDLRMWDQSQTVVGVGSSPNPALPLEVIQLGPGDEVGYSLLVRKDDGTNLRYFRLQAGPAGTLEYSTEGAVTDALGAESAFTIGAVDVASAGGGAFVGGAANPTTDYSADGPRRLFYDVNGDEITPGDILASGGLIVEKPDYAAAANVSTATPGFNPFDGTSAAVAHAAAIGAMALQGRSGVDVEELRNILNGAALDIDAPGTDRTSGRGVLRADLAVVGIFADGFESGDLSRWGTE